MGLEGVKNLETQNTAAILYHLSFNYVEEKKYRNADFQSTTRESFFCQEARLFRVRT